jgi:hypothetical protein
MHCYYNWCGNNSLEVEKMKRDAQKDLEICNRATVGPWVNVKVNTSCGYCYKVGTEMDVAKGHNGAACLYDDYTSFNETPHEQIESNAQFIAESREALPHWINQAMEAKKLIEQAAEEIENCYGKETELSKKMREFLGGEQE